MAEVNKISKAELLARIQSGWDQFSAFLTTLTPEQLTRPTDAAGWTVSDHLSHIAFWEGSIPALLRGHSYCEYLGVDEATFQSNDIDRINAVIWQQYETLSLEGVLGLLRGGHQRLIASIESLNEADLQRSSRDFQADNLQDIPVLEWIINNSVGHYEEHMPWIRAIVEDYRTMTDSTAFSKDQLLQRIQDGWNDFTAYLNTLSEVQMTQPKDAAGWTAKDHVMHLAVWEDGINAVLERQSRRERMGLDEAVWQRWDFDEINEVIRRQHQDLPLAEVRQKFRDAHERLVAKVESMSEEDLQRSYADYQADARRTDPVFNAIAGNTFGHYAEHKPWIAAIVAQG